MICKLNTDLIPDAKILGIKEKHTAKPKSRQFSRCGLTYCLPLAVLFKYCGVIHASLSRYLSFDDIRCDLISTCTMLMFDTEEHLLPRDTPNVLIVDRQPSEIL